MVEIRKLLHIDELESAMRLEAEIWGAQDPTPRSLLVVFAHHGGVVLGAFDAGQLVGVSLGFPGLDRNGQTYLHSHLLGVRPEYRSQRLGEALKRAQWRYAEEVRLPYIGWTYDPLLAPNAWFNLGVLGARVEDVLENVYGSLDDALNGTLPTHRLWVTWNAGRAAEEPVSLDDRILPIPANVAELRAARPDVAREQADQYVHTLQDWWSAGWRISGVGRDTTGVWYRWSRKTREGWGES